MLQMDTQAREKMGREHTAAAEMTESGTVLSLPVPFAVRKGPRSVHLRCPVRTFGGTAQASTYQLRSSTSGAASYSVHAAAPPRPAAAQQQPPANDNDVGGDPQNLVRGRVCGHLQNFTTSPMAHSWLVLGQVSGAGDRTSLRWSLSDPGRRRQQGCSVTVGFRPFVQGRHPRHAPPTYGPGRSLLLITRCGAQSALY